MSSFPDGDFSICDKGINKTYDNRELKHEMCQGDNKPIEGQKSRHTDIVFFKITMEQFPCHVFRDVNPVVSGIREVTLNNPPSNTVLLDLSNHIGNSTMQLAIELDLDSTTIQQKQYKHKNKLLEQTKEILQIWSKTQQPKPTLLLLIKALHRIGKMGALRGVRF
ncbi:Hypothetical predicted protein [Mytilus galloprovincialis]|uniref:Death domain-containing protein n=1 Tax=Mytilus galloprovincialis TaxID=29158 RepID=A0A8B6EU18_MYTGA|nr:Hypothetical predicted protein [Mytilus galloprovincialis]